MRSFLFLILSPVIILGFNVLPGCKKSRPTQEVSSPPTVVSGSKKYLALGDSYTIGQNVQTTERFPYLLAKSLRQQNIGIDDPQYIAATGWTTANLQNAIISQNPSGNFDLVTLLIGVNDQYQHRDTADYRIRFTQLIEKSIMLAGNRKERVFVLSIPDYSATPFVSADDKSRVKAEINWFNAINKQITQQYNIVYADITPLTREAANDLTLLTNDNLHYSAKEYQQWADFLLPLVKPIL